MNQLIFAIPTGIAAFIATNLDDILVLSILYAQVNQSLRRRHIVIGQYLGFIILLLASLPGFFGSYLVPSDWIRWLGIVPILLGLGTLLKSDTEEEDNSLEINTQPVATGQNIISRWLSPQTCGVAAITIANGGDNIGIYVPLFASSTWESLLVILSIFLSLVGVWCYIADRLTRLPMITNLLTAYGSTFVPCVLIGLGVFIVKEDLTLTAIALIASYLWVLSVGKEPEIIEQKVINTHKPLN